MLGDLQVSFCDPESAIRKLACGSFVSVGFNISGADAYSPPKVVRLQRKHQFAEAAAAAGAAPENDVYALYRCLLQLLCLFHRLDYVVRSPWCSG